MRERPEGSELLQIAAATLREQILPALAEGQRYAALMILNAMSIAERQLRLDERPLENEWALLDALLRSDTRRTAVEPLPPEARDEPRDLRAHVTELERELARRVRAGSYDRDGLGQRVLWQISLQRVRESAPRFLESEGIE
jgi:hypothetical protein